MADTNIIPDRNVLIQQMNFHAMTNFTPAGYIEIPATSVAVLSFDFNTTNKVNQILSDRVFHYTYN